MIIDLRGMKQVAEVSHNTCEYHKKNPGDRNYPGCTCSAAYSSRYVPDPNPPKTCSHCEGTGVEKEK